jgi:hypothetical protein
MNSDASLGGTLDTEYPSDYRCRYQKPAENGVIRWGAALQDKTGQNHRRNCSQLRMDEKLFNGLKSLYS